MNSFTFYNPTKIIFGKGAEASAGAEMKKKGAKRVLIHYGGGSAVRSGLISRVKESLEHEGLWYTELGGVKPNPVLSMVRRGIDLCMKQQIDSILAIGGGSVIDSSKAISIGVANPNIDVWDFFLKKADVVKCLPVASVLTIAAAGSETSNSCVIQNEEGMLKRGLGSDTIRPVLAFMNPELLYTLPAYQIGCGVADIMLHTMERYFSDVLGNELTDQFSEALLRTVIKYGDAFVNTPDNYQAASEIMWAGSISNNNLTGLGARGDFSSHQLGHELSAMFDAAHGATLSAVWGTWARFVYRNNPSRFARYGRNVWGIDTQEEQQAAKDAISRTEEYFVKLGMPVDIPGLIGRPMTEEELDIVADKCTFFGGRTIGTFYVIDRDQSREIYAAANKARA